MAFSVASLILATLSVTLVGCGDDSGDGNGNAAGGSGGSGGGGGGSAVGSAACNTECEMQGAQNCLAVASVEECKKVCGDLKILPAACYQAFEASTQCHVAHDNVCFTVDPDPCADEFHAIVTDC